MGPAHLSVSLPVLRHQGAGVWIPDPDAVWVSAQLLQDYSPGEEHLRLQLPDGEVRRIPIRVSTPVF